MNDIERSDVFEIPEYSLKQEIQEDLETLYEQWRLFKGRGIDVSPIEESIEYHRRELERVIRTLPKGGLLKTHGGPANDADVEGAESA